MAQPSAESDDGLVPPRGERVRGMEWVVPDHRGCIREREAAGWEHDRDEILAGVDSDPAHSFVLEKR